MSRVEFYRHALTEEDIAAVAETLRSVFLTSGPRAAGFEEAFARYLGVEHTAAVSSCTSALYLCLRALNIGPGDEVITTPMTFIATANAILHAGARPVFVDVEQDTGNIDAGSVERAITSRTRAVIPVHLYGLMADVRQLHDICRRHHLMLIEDAAHSTEAVRDGLRPGHLGQAACFSFYATKNLTCGEGGAIATNDPALAESIRRLRSHGMSKEAASRYTGKYQHWDMVTLGYKANLSDINAALLAGQLPRLDRQLTRREQIASRYEEAFSRIPGVRFPIVRRGAKSARHLFTIWVDPSRRDEWLARLQDKGIGVAVNYRAIHLLSYYRAEMGFRRGDFPNAEAIGDQTITLPLYPAMSDDDVEKVIEAVAQVSAECRVMQDASAGVI
jgi:UDP-4-amino-4-deoxy-L-arabinose-oxoglutarate aminotransferase